MPYPDVVNPYGPHGSGYGPELVRNGDFTSETGDWFIQNGTITGGALVVNDPVAFHVIATQSSVVDIGKSYLVTLMISAYTSGSVGVNCGQSTGTAGTKRSATGTFSEVLVAAGSLPSIVLQCGNAGFVGSIDKVSVKEVLS